MRLLILGGTWFLGRTLAELAIGRGWDVTTFSRGLQGQDVPGTARVRGDRGKHEDVTRLAAAGPWDAVVDTSGYTAHAVDTAAKTLRGRAARYVLISTVNAFRGWPFEPLTDASPVYEEDGQAAQPLPSAATILTAHAVEYGRGKAASERAALHAFGDDCLIVRPGVILGPYEYVGRLPWLLRRMERGGRVLAGGDASRPIQPVDVRDVAAFILGSVVSGLSGAMNVTAPLGHTTYGELLERCRDVTGRQAHLEWVDGDWLAVQDVAQWTEIPLWRTAPGTWNVSSPRAWAAGLACRPIARTVADTWEWIQSEDPVPHERAAQIGLDPAKEARLLAAWGEHAKSRGRGQGARS